MINLLFSVSPIVPELRVNLINGSPRLIAGNTAIEAEFEVSRPVAGVRCYLRSETDRVYKNCKLKLYSDSHTLNLSGLSRFIWCCII